LKGTRTGRGDRPQPVAEVGSGDRLADSGAGRRIGGHGGGPEAVQRGRLGGASCSSRQSPPSARVTARSTRTRGRRVIGFTPKMKPSLGGLVHLNTHTCPYQEGISATGPHNCPSSRPTIQVGATQSVALRRRRPAGQELAGAAEASSRTQGSTGAKTRSSSDRMTL
jgi:hypothetical protein